MIRTTGTNGHFEQGRWVVNPEPVPQNNDTPIDARISGATNAIVAAVDDFAKVTRDLVTSEEGKKYIEKTMKDTTIEVQRTFDEVLARAKAEIDEKIKSIK